MQKSRMLLPLVLLLATSAVASPVSSQTCPNACQIQPPDGEGPVESERHWKLQRGKHWQLASPTFEDPAVTDAIEQDRGSCSAGMVEVRGRMRVGPTAFFVEAMQSLMCTNWISRDFPQRCAEFDRDRWIAFQTTLGSVDMNFCIDRYEYPNIQGQYPWVLVSYTDAVAICAEQEKRLCSEDEWTFACEGEQAWPCPHGFTRSSEACVIDKLWMDFDPRAWRDPSSRAAMLELDRLWQGEPAGARDRCRSPFGVYEMTGNVDEWTESTLSSGYRSVLKGGYWAPVRNRCRVSTRAHDEHFAFYQQGFRCCADLK